MHSFRARVALTLQMAYQADRARTVGVFVLSILQQAAAIVTALLLRGVVERASNHLHDLVPYAISLAATAALGFLFNRWAINVFVVLNEHNIERWNREIIDLSTSVEGVEHYENPAYLNQLELVRGQPTAIGLVPGSLAWVFGSMVLLVGALVILATVQPVLLILPLFAVPTVFAVRRAEAALQQSMVRTSEDRRVANDHFEQATAPSAGKEVRMLGISSELITRQRVRLLVVNRALSRTERRNALSVGGARLLFSIAYLGALLFVIEEGIRGRLSAGDVVLTVFLAGSITTQVRVTIDGLRRALNGLAILDRVYWLYDFAASRQRQAPVSVPVPDRLTEGIVFDHVSFRYPGTDREVLSDVSFELPAGSVIALVGDNGAGKTTLVKLLAGMYQPSSGRILIDGNDLMAFDADLWRKRSTAAFQDFARLELILREAVGVGDIEFIDSDDRVRQALDRSGGTSLLDQVSAGLDTQLGLSFGGTDLSGGQWQRVALARTTMRETPLLLVLDEPTASLDPGVERDVFIRYAALAKDARVTSNGITLLVTHRFNSVVTTDLIVMLKDGRLVEYGSHSELLARKGEYAELFDLQATHYR